MRIVALDVATRTGIAVGSSDGKPKAWSVDLGRGKSEDYRFSQVLMLTHGLIEAHTPDLIVCEAFIGGPKASAYLTGLVACVRGCAANRRIKCVMVYPATVRKHFLGKNPSAKEFPGLSQAKAKLAIKERVAERCRLLGWEVDDLDCADALATLDWAQATYGNKFHAAPVGGLFNG